MIRSVVAHTRSFATLVLVASLAACGGGSSGGNNVTPPPPGGTGGGGFSLSVSPTSVTVPRSGTTTLTVSVTRTGSFTGAVSLEIPTLPAGVTAAFNPAQVPAGSSTSTVTFTASGTANATTASFTIRGTGTSVTLQTIDVPITVTVPPPQTGSFSLSLSATSFLAPPSPTLTHMPILSITRQAGFTGAVSFSVTGLPATLFLGFTPTSTTGNATTVVVLNAGAPNGTYTATIRGASSSGDQTVTMQIVVAPPSTGQISWRFCPNGNIHFPAWFFAVKDGGGPWTRVVPNDSGFRYSFNVSQATAQVAMVTIDSGVPRTTVYQFTAQEMAAFAASECVLWRNATGRTVNGQVTGLTFPTLYFVGMDWWFGSGLGPGSYSLQNLGAGPLDLIGVRANVAATTETVVERMVIKRGLNPASGGTNPIIDFGASDSFAPVTATWTFGNTNGEPFGVSQYFTTFGGSIGGLSAIPQPDRTATTRTLYGVPIAQTIPGDLQEVIATINTSSTNAQTRATRQLIWYSRTVTDRIINFGPPMPQPSVTSVSRSGAGLVRAQGTLPTEYNSGVVLDVKSTGTVPRFASVYATRGFLGGSGTYLVEMPDLTTVLGWDTQWNIRPGDLTNWWVNGGGPVLDFFDTRYAFRTLHTRWSGAGTGITPPAEGATYFMARTSGTVVP
jgi:hypothetical protein